MKTNIVIDISLQIPYLVNFWDSSYEPKCYQPIKLQDSLKCLKKEVNDEVYFRQGDKYQSFLQGDTTILCVYNQACPKYPKQQVYNIFAISQEKCEGWSWFFACG